MKKKRMVREIKRLKMEVESLKESLNKLVGVKKDGSNGRQP